MSFNLGQQSSHEGKIELKNATFYSSLTKILSRPVIIKMAQNCVSNRSSTHMT
jgi:hypothetical protein